MDCPRCKGLMLEDWFQDIQDETGTMSFEGYRCPSCGEVVDSVILQNRSLGAARVPARRRRRLSPAGIS